MLEKYFETKIGVEIKKNIVTGEDKFTDVFERVYVIEVIGVKKGQLHVEVQSYDVAPSGSRLSRSDKYIGETVISLADYQTKESVIIDIIKKEDTDFYEKYKNKAAVFRADKRRENLN
jgi:hypothetical protein